MPDAKVENGKVDIISLKKPLSFISRISGQSGRIQGVYIEVENKYDSMLNHAKLRMKQNSNPKREPYDLLTNSCIHFVKEVTERGGVSTPWMIDPRPSSYMGEFRTDYPDLDYKNDILVIEGIGEF